VPELIEKVTQEFEGITQMSVEFLEARTAEKRAKIR
jgi:hypothetical protein